MTSMIHFASIFVSFTLLALACSIIHVMVGTYRDRIVAAILLGDFQANSPASLGTKQRRSLLTSRA